MSTRSTRPGRCKITLRGCDVHYDEVAGVGGIFQQAAYRVLHHAIVHLQPQLVANVLAEMLADPDVVGVAQRLQVVALEIDVGGSAIGRNQTRCIANQVESDQRNRFAAVGNNGIVFDPRVDGDWEGKLGQSGQYAVRHSTYCAYLKVGIAYQRFHR